MKYLDALVSDIITRRYGWFMVDKSTRRLLCVMHTDNVKHFTALLAIAGWDMSTLDVHRHSSYPSKRVLDIYGMV